MVRYAFYGVVTNKRAGELLQEIRQANTNVVGCVVFYADRAVILEFANEPISDELENLKNLLDATRYEKMKEEETEMS